MEEAASRDVIDKFANIVKELKENGFQISYNEDEMKKQISGIGIDKLNKLIPCLEGIGKSVDKFMSDDPIEKIEGALILVAGITTMIPVVGPFVGAMFTMLESVLSAFGGKKKTGMAEVLDNVIQKAFGKYDDIILKRDMAGLRSVLVNIHCHLNAFTETKTYRRDEVLEWNTKIASLGVNFLGQLLHEIKIYSKNNSSKDDHDVAFQAIRAVDYVEAFCQLSALRELILTQYDCILRNVRDYLGTTAVATKAHIIRCQEQDKELAEFMSLSYTDVEYAAFISVFNKFERPATSALLNRYNSSSPSAINLTPVIMKLHDEGSTYYAYKVPKLFDNSDVQWIGVKNEATWGRYNFALFSFVKIKEEDNIFYIIVHDVPKYGSAYLSACQSRHNYKTVVVSGEPTGKENEWKLIRMEKNGRAFYLIGSMKYPAMFLSKQPDNWQNNSMIIVSGDPGSLGYWYFSAEPHKSNCILL